MVAGPLTVVDDFEHDDSPALGLGFGENNPGSRREGSPGPSGPSSDELLDEKPFVTFTDPLSGAFGGSDGKAGYGKGPKNNGNSNYGSSSSQPSYGNSSSGGKKPSNSNNYSNNNSNSNKPSNSNSNNNYSNNNSNSNKPSNSNSNNNYKPNNNNSNTGDDYNKNKNKDKTKTKTKTKNKDKGANKFKDEGAHDQIDDMATFLQKQKEKEAKKAARVKAQTEKKAKKDAAKAVKAAKRELQKAQKQQKKARVLETEETKNTEKQGRLLIDPSERVIIKKEAAKAQKQEAKALGVLNEEIGYPHRSRSNFISTAIDVSMARSDGKCGKSAQWAPCALVPTRGRAEPTPCCDFASNHCLPVSQCDCPHCVDYSRINQATAEIKASLAKLDYEDNIKGELVRNRDLFHIWAVQNIFQPRLLEEVLMRLTEQTKNVIVILDNAAESKCINSDLSLEMSMKNTVDMTVVKMNINFFQKNDQYHQVLKETLDQFIATNTEDRCVRKLEIFKHKVDKTVGAIQKAVMKMRNTLSLSDEEKHIQSPADLANHFEPGKSRAEKRKDIILSRLQLAANQESARLLAIED